MVLHLVYVLSERGRSACPAGVVESEVYSTVAAPPECGHNFRGMYVLFSSGEVIEMYGRRRVRSYCLIWFTAGYDYEARVLSSGQTEC